MIGFIYEIHTSETFLTGHTVREIIALSAIITVLAPEKRMAIVAIADLIAVFAFMDKCTVYAVL